MNSLFKQILAQNISVGNNNPDPTYIMDVNGLIGNSSGLYAGNFIDIGDGQLFDNSPVTSVDWQQRFLYDTEQLTSANWNNRQLFPNNMTSPTLDWQNNILYSIEGIGTFPIIFNYPFPSVDWQHRQLWYADDSGFNQYAVLSWESGTCVSPFDHNTTLNFFTRILSGNWIATNLSVSGFSVVTTNQTGSFITTGQTGAFGGGGSGYVTTGQTGQFVTTGQTGAFITTGQTGAFSGNTGILTGVFYPLNTNPSQFLYSIGNQNYSGALYITGNTGSNLSPAPSSGNWKLNSAGGIVTISGSGNTASFYAICSGNMPIYPTGGTSLSTGVSIGDTYLWSLSNISPLAQSNQGSFTFSIGNVLTQSFGGTGTFGGYITTTGTGVPILTIGFASLAGGSYATGVFSGLSINKITSGNFNVDGHSTFHSTASFTNGFFIGNYTKPIIYNPSLGLDFGNITIANVGALATNSFGTNTIQSYNGGGFGLPWLNTNSQGDSLIGDVDFAFNGNVINVFNNNSSPGIQIMCNTGPITTYNNNGTSTVLDDGAGNMQVIGVGSFTGGLFVSGQSVLTGSTASFVTTGQTGQFASSANLTATGTSLSSWTGLSTGLYYPRTGNPAGYLTSISGSVIPSNHITGATGIINWAIANTFYNQLTGNTTFSFTGQTDGQTIIVSIANTGTNNFSGIWPTGTKWSFGNVPYQSSGSFTDIYTFVCITGAVYGNVVQGF